MAVLLISSRMSPGSIRTRSRTGTPDPHEHGLHTSAISHWNSGSTRALSRTRILGPPERDLAPEPWVHASPISHLLPPHSPHLMPPSIRVMRTCISFQSSLSASSPCMMPSAEAPLAKPLLLRCGTHLGARLLATRACLLLIPDPLLPGVSWML